jgi:hypothetical protein
LTRLDTIRGRLAPCLLLLIAATQILGCVLLRKSEDQDKPAPAEAVETAPQDTSTEPPADPAPPPAEQPADSEVQSVPEIDEVSLVDAEPSEPRLLQDEDERISASSLRDDLWEAQRLSAELIDRKLTSEQRAQVESGRAFLDDAREALRLQDLERAGVLLEKCLVLFRDAEVNSGS